MIIGEVRRYLRDNNAIRVSRSMRDLAYRALQAREEIQRTHQRDATLDEIAEKLGERERSIIMKRFYNGKTQMEIAAEIGISQAQVSRLEKSAIDKIRKEM